MRAGGKGHAPLDTGGLLRASYLCAKSSNRFSRERVRPLRQIASALCEASIELFHDATPQQTESRIQYGEELVVKSEKGHSRQRRNVLVLTRRADLICWRQGR